MHKFVSNEDAPFLYPRSQEHVAMVVVTVVVAAAVVAVVVA
jgi:hypothetical protein